MLRFISLSLVATAAAQMDMKALIGDMSPQCQAAAGSLVTSDFSACSNLMGLVNVLGASGSLIAPLDTWVNSICSITPCSASTIATAAATVQAGCDADAKKGVATALEVTALVPNYAAVSGFLTGGVSSLAPALAKAPQGILVQRLYTWPRCYTLGQCFYVDELIHALNAYEWHAYERSPDSIAISSGSSSNSTYSSAGKTPANGGAPSSANSVAIPVFASFALVGTASVFVALLWSTSTLFDLAFIPLCLSAFVYLSWVFISHKSSR
ncbi:hypothetical protein PCANC_28861 [Puccinia coronata f. sp. avenae]|uniref:Uncharacterized protein n=1 Tax=Puccinia coronata f. sp. avenae TaxID=200324 RepID=A0A2N5RWA2_9BASI|nr:hypothetical protein PCANC_28861 [Puccinia coronata f. sp. avenae]